jgi:serine/threonine protein kinase
MLTDQYDCKLTDFGMARYVSDTSKARKMTICGTNEYMAPEMLFDEEYTLAIDIFSFGMVLFEIIKRDQIGDHHHSGSFLVRRPQEK